MKDAKAKLAEIVKQQKKLIGNDEFQKIIREMPIPKDEIQQKTLSDFAGIQSRNESLSSGEGSAISNKPNSVHIY